MSIVSYGRRCGSRECGRASIGREVPRSATIRLATPDDAEQIGSIYAPHVRDGATSFEIDPPTADAMRARIASFLDYAPWLVCERGGEIAGYAYAGKHRERLAYQWDVEVSVYVHEHARRAGVGRGLYVSLFRLMALQGFYNAYAGITLPNPESVGLHESLGFTPVGVYQGAGYKLGVWHDVGWWQLALQPRHDDPSPPRRMAEARLSSGWAAALGAGEAFLR